MYPAICSNCGKETEVPFMPRSDKPVYCRECFAERRASAPRGYGNY
jgi:CxxC-x17-CxxC domain-containing protein